ncbi:MAG: chromate transporter [Lachnospiraceae bacterium]
MKKLLDLYISFFHIGALTFGGGLAMLPMLKREVVEKHGWITEEEMLDIFAIGQCTPGVIAVNTATYIGYKKAGIWGGILATLGIISPSILIICIIASVLSPYMENTTLQHAFAGIRVVVCALMLNTAIMMARKGIQDKLGILLFLSALLLASFSPVPTAIIIVLSGIFGVIVKKWGGIKS